MKRNVKCRLTSHTRCPFLTDLFCTYWRDSFMFRAWHLKVCRLVVLSSWVFVLTSPSGSVNSFTFWHFHCVPCVWWKLIFVSSLKPVQVLWESRSVVKCANCCFALRKPSISLVAEPEFQHPNATFSAAPRPWRLVTGLLPLGVGSISRLVHVGFRVDIVPLGRVIFPSTSVFLC